MIGTTYYDLEEIVLSTNGIVHLARYDGSPLCMKSARSSWRRLTVTGESLAGVRICERCLADERRAWWNR